MIEASTIFKMEVRKMLELYEWMMQFRCGQFVVTLFMGIILLAFVLAIVTHLRNGGTSWRGKPAEKKRRYTAGSLVTTALSASGIKASGKSLTIAQSSLSATPADIEKSRHLENIKWKKYKQSSRARKKRGED